ncbi:hypothetical protein K8B33_03660 [Alcanivorax sp. JB21]|uniref:hypothetical protein n=1 Tax=Alcanivorax limicola TaxID=2874102 RepID=UPI001CBC7DF0|nr:hypothetical protein [Alcanivorax limicola]MBZ2188177.1 hypothetical protein [Alcanivorax limicola]
MTDEQKPVEQHPAPAQQRQAPARRNRRDHSTYEPAPGNFRPVWGLLLFLAGIVALVALAAAVVDTLVLN